MEFSELTGEQQRQLIDSTEVFDAWRDARKDHSRRFAGSIRWVVRKDRDYLLRKVGMREISLGPRSETTEETFARFFEGRKASRERLAGLSARLDQIAPVNRAMGLGRVPTLVARILRDLEDRDLLGHQLMVVGTNALFAYEAKAGVRIASGLLATGDVDLLYDARQRLSLVGREIRQTGLLGILKKLDHSFSAVRKNAYRAVNRDGFFVDLIRPSPRDAMKDALPAALSEEVDDLHGSPIEGLAWLVNAPKFEATAIAADGYPTHLVCPDPRAFALHKAWISAQPNRDPRKRGRDMDQAKTCATLASKRLGLSFEDGADLTALPIALRSLGSGLLGDKNAPAEREAQRRLSPSWS